MVFEELAEVAVVVVADRLIERERLAAHLQHAAGLVDRQAGRARPSPRRVGSQPLLLDQVAA